MVGKLGDRREIRNDEELPVSTARIDEGGSCDKSVAKLTECRSTGVALADTKFLLSRNRNLNGGE